MTVVFLPLSLHPSLHNLIAGLQVLSLFITTSTLWSTQVQGIPAATISLTVQWGMSIPGVSTHIHTKTPHSGDGTAMMLSLKRLRTHRLLLCTLGGGGFTSRKGGGVHLVGAGVRAITPFGGEWLQKVGVLSPILVTC